MELFAGEPGRQEWHVASGGVSGGGGGGRLGDGHAGQGLLHNSSSLSGPLPAGGHLG